MSDLKRAHVQNIYKPLSFVFGILVILLIGGVAYAGLSSTIISITPKITKVTASFPVTITTTASTDSATFQGTITATDHSATVTVTPKGTGTPVPAHATGQVTLKNTTAKVQPLSAGTRLQSTDGIIVRTTARVDVPAGGTVVADVVADPLGETGNVAPGKFIIVALWPGLQDKIYGESTSILSGGLASAGTSLSLEELTAASNQAEEQIRAEVGASHPGSLISLEPSLVVSVPKANVPSSSYKVTVTIKVTTVTYQASQLTDQAKAELIKALPDGQSLDTIEDPKINIQHGPGTDKVILQLNSQATAHLSPNNPLLKPNGYTGLSVIDIQKKLSDASIIKTVNVKLSPWWRTNAPDQAERITLRLLPAQL